MVRRDLGTPQPLPDPLETVLLVDPDPDTRLLYGTVLQPIARSIVEAQDGADALGRALAHPPGLVVTETRLARVDGFALCALLRSDPATIGAKILVVTSDASPGDAARAREAGADAVLVKPCDVVEMLETARRLLLERGDTVAAGDAPVARNTARAGVAGRLPARAAGQAGMRRRIQSRSYDRRVTTAPPNAPPPLLCPCCDALLAYVHSHIGGVSEKHPEQWDSYTCGKCGPYLYRHRTRKLTIAS